MSTAYNSKIVTDGLVSYCDFANKRSYDSTAPTVVTDLITTNTGVITGATSHDGSNLDLDGTISNASNGRVLLPTLPAVTDYTIEIAFRNDGPGHTGEQWATLFGDAQARRLLVNPSGGPLLAQMGGGNHTSTTATVPGQWNQVSFVYDSGETESHWYINGEPAGTASGARVCPTTSYLGSYDAVHYWFDGPMGFVRLYNTVLTDAQIKQNFNAIRGRYGI